MNFRVYCDETRPLLQGARLSAFELLADGTVEALCLKIRKAGIPYGFGGVAAVGTGTLPAESILKEHYRLGSSMVILSRSFCNADEIGDIEIIRKIFETGVREMRSFEKEIEVHSRYFDENRAAVAESVRTIVEKISKR